MLQNYKERVDVLYSDTDSIIIEKLNINLLIDDISSDYSMGKFKVEGLWDEGYFIGSKIYALRKGNIFKIIIKGIDCKKLLLNDLQIFNLFKNIVNQDLNEGLVYNKQNLFKKDLNMYTINTDNSKLNLTLNYDKRLKVFEGNRWVSTKPLYINEL